MFLLASLLGRQQEQTAKITQQFERVHQELEEQVKESSDLLCIANEFLQQEIGDRVCAEDALVVSETRLRLLMEAIPLLICYVDAKQLYLFGNQQYELLFSKYSLNLEGKHLRDVLGKSNYEQMKLGIETALSGERVIDQQILTVQQGKTVEVHLNLIPHFGSNMQVLGFFTLAQDLTEYKLAQLN
jgi:PAS domain S-box-containing protein